MINHREARIVRLAPLLGLLFGADRLGIVRVKLSNALLPHAHKRARGEIVDRLPNAFYIRKRVLPDGALAPFFAFLLALVRSAH